jgi:hypothetical protein
VTQCAGSIVLVRIVTRKAPARLSGESTIEEARARPYRLIKAKMRGKSFYSVGRFQEERRPLGQSRVLEAM